MTTSKPICKTQATIPQPVRAAPRVVEGDEAANTIEAGQIILTKAPPRAPPNAVQPEDPFGTFTESDSEDDRIAFATL